MYYSLSIWRISIVLRKLNKCLIELHKFDGARIYDDL